MSTVLNMYVEAAQGRGNQQDPCKACISFLTKVHKTGAKPAFVPFPMGAASNSALSDGSELTHPFNSSFLIVHMCRVERVEVG